MRRILDSDTVTRVDEAGDKLVLLVTPRYRDVLACEELEREEALKAMDNLKATGVDVDAIMAEAQKDPDAVKQARRAIAESPAGPSVRRFRLKAVAVALYLDGEKFGGEAILTVYDEMDAASAAWMDAQVTDVWKTATPDDASARGEEPDADRPVIEAVEST